MSCRSFDVGHRLSSCGIRAYLLRGMWGLSSPTRDPSHVPCIARWILYHWATREVPIQSFLKLVSYKTDQGASFRAQSVKNLPATQETQVQSLGQEDPPGEGNCNPLQYSCLENPVDRGAWQATLHGVARVRYDLGTKPPSKN